MPDRAAFSGPLHFLPSLVYLRSLEKCRLVVEAQAPYAIRLRQMTGDLSAAAHGYDPRRFPEMQGIFYAKGPALIEETEIPSFENVHIYPLIMELLGLGIPEEIDGDLSVLEGILRNTD